MKILATLVAVVSLSIAAPVFACPHSDKAAGETTKTAEKTEKTDAKADTAKKSDKTEKAPAKTADGAKKAEKVSSK